MIPALGGGQSSTPSRPANPGSRRYRSPAAMQRRANGRRWRLRLGQLGQAETSQPLFHRGQVGFDGGQPRSSRASMPVRRRCCRSAAVIAVVPLKGGLPIFELIAGIMASEVTKVTFAYRLQRSRRRPAAAPTRLNMRTTYVAQGCRSGSASRIPVQPSIRAGCILPGRSCRSTRPRSRRAQVRDTGRAGGFFATTAIFEWRLLRFRTGRKLDQTGQNWTETDSRKVWGTDKTGHHP